MLSIKTRRVRHLFTLVLVLAGTLAAQHQDPNWHAAEDPLNHWLGLNQIEGNPVHASALITTIFQQNVRGGLSTQRQKGRTAGSYELELAFDLHRLAGLGGAEFIMITEGGLSAGITGPAVGSLSEVNADATGNLPVAVTEAYWNQHLLEDRLFLRLGKLDLKCNSVFHGCQAAFDGSAYANQETDEFLNAALFSNSTIPFPDNGLGAILIATPTPGLYFAGGLADAQGSGTETGFNTAFHGGDHFLYLAECGLSGHLLIDEGWLPGTCRAGAWYDPQPKERFDGGPAKRDDSGFYLSVDQMLWRENRDEGDLQGVGLFGRLGLCDDAVNPVELFWSGGGQYLGLVPGRDADALGLGFVRHQVSRQDGSGFVESGENVWELYYQCFVNDLLNLTADLQYITDPGAASQADDAFVVGLRVNLLL